jgi:nucleoside-diphosphate-sugar epimerase
MTVAVTGASGFIGRHLVAHLAGRGDTVVSIGRPLDAVRLAAALPGVNTVVHLAGVVATVREREFFAVNVDLTRAVARAADRALLPIFRWSQRGVLPLVGRPTAAYTFVHVRDLVRAITAAVDSNREGDTMFVGHPAPVAPRALLERVRSVTGGAARIVRIPTAALRIAAAAGDVGGLIRGTPLPINSRRYAELMAEGFVCRVDRLRDHLGVVAEIDLTSGLADTAAWYRHEGWL